MWDRKAGKVSRPFLFNIGLLCSKTFDDAIFPELFEAKYGLKKSEMVKMNIKGVFQIWMKDGSYHEIDLKECHAWTREGCKNCPDFAAEHSDIATGGIGEDNDWTLTIVRTELGEEVINRMIDDGTIIARPAQEDEEAMKLLRLLSIVSRRRWPEFADPAPTIGVPPPKKKAPAPDPAAAPATAADARRSPLRMGRHPTRPHRQHPSRPPDRREAPRTAGSTRRRLRPRRDGPRRPIHRRGLSAAWRRPRVPRQARRRTTARLRTARRRWRSGPATRRS